MNKFWLLSIVCVFFVWTASEAHAQSGGSDAIAVRIIPNTQHLSITRWYESQGFQGAPQLLKVDGYEAVRDGRTVYVNAANIDINQKKIYTNIYLISYNQNPGVGTGDILGQIIARWKFNDNLTLEPDKTCAISSNVCVSDLNCGSEQICNTSTNSCELKTPKNCLIDAECPTNFFCNSLKAKIGRDVIRVGRLNDLNQALTSYYQNNGRYPSLMAGTYITGNSLSVWPSWYQTFLTDIAASPTLIDPVNRLGFCGEGYEPGTCWDAVNKKFSSLNGNTIVLPTSSRIFMYTGTESGSKYNLCGTIETGEDGYGFVPSLITGLGCAVSGGGTASNTAPVISDKFLMGVVGDEFVGYIKAYDPEGDSLTWALDTSNANWSSWGVAPKLEVTSNPGQARIYAPKSGNSDSYNITITVSDNRGGSITTTTPIKISGASVNISADDAEYILDPTIPFKYSFTFSGRQLASPNSYALTKITPNNSWPLFPLSGSVSPIDGIYQVNYSSIIPTSTSFTSDANYKYRINVGNTSKEFNIKIKSPAPTLDIKCDGKFRVGQSFSCELGLLNQKNQTIKYSTSTVVAMTGSYSIVNNKFEGSVASAGSHSLRFRATNEYGAASEQSFTLKITNYCGDGTRQFPNGEGRGGIYNDGYEDCDNMSGVTDNVASSSPYLQYGCRSTSTTPFPIISNSYCAYKPPYKQNGTSFDIGGFCGDGYCQVEVNGSLREDSANCESDCAAVTPPPTPNTCQNPVEYRGYNYPLVRIGDQCWFRDNLRATKYRDGSPVIEMPSNTGWSSDTDGAYCWYNNSTTTGATYGALYNYYAVNKTNRKLCPDGWHVPTITEFDILKNSLDREAGGKLKESGNSHWSSPNTGANNSSGFTALPGNGRRSDGVWLIESGHNNPGTYANFWSATPLNSGSALASSISHDSTDYFVASADGNYSGLAKKFGYSVRCIQDKPMYSLNYIASSSGVVTGAISQSVYHDSSGSSVTAVANSGFQFDKWSDGLTASTRIDTNVIGDSAYTAFFKSVTSGPSTSCGRIKYNGENYETISVGNQCWFKENLRTTQYNDRDDISESDFAWYDDDKNSSAHYGILYSSDAVNSGKLCPSGWLVPDNDDWEKIKIKAGNNNPGLNLMEVGTAHWNVNSGLDSFGFSARGSGYKEDGHFQSLREYAVFWSQTTSYSSRDYLLINGSLIDGPTSIQGDYGFSVRCVKNESLFNLYE